jgi:hypothetical protein
MAAVSLEPHVIAPAHDGVRSRQSGELFARSKRSRHVDRDPPPRAALSGERALLTAGGVETARGREARNLTLGDRDVDARDPAGFPRAEGARNGRFL